jgi:hypothetical protein
MSGSVEKASCNNLVSYSDSPSGSSSTEADDEVDGHSGGGVHRRNGTLSDGTTTCGYLKISMRSSVGRLRRLAMAVTLWGLMLTEVRSKGVRSKGVRRSSGSANLPLACSPRKSSANGTA